MASLAPAEKAPTGKPLKVGSPHDPAEREADRIADILTASEEPAMPVCTACAAGGAPCAACGVGGSGGVLRRQVAGGSDGSSGGEMVAPPSVHQVLSEPGELLPSGLRDIFSTRLGQPLDQARVINNPLAHQVATRLGALAVTQENQIFFAAGEYQPHTDAGRHLIAHELTHVLQHRAGAPAALRRAPNPHLLAGDAPVVSEGAPAGAVQEAALAAATHGVLHTAAAARDPWTDEAFIQALVEAVLARLTDAPEGTDPALRTAAREAASLREPLTTTGESLGIPEALRRLSQLRDTGSATVALLAYAMSGHFGRLLGPAVPQPAAGTGTSTPPAPDADPNWDGMLPIDLLFDDLSRAAVALDDPIEAMRLELEGTLGLILDRRRAFAAATEQSIRAQLGEDIGRFSRQALLLNDALQRLENRDPGGATGDTPLDRSMQEVQGEIQTLARDAETEGETLRRLGDPLRLLGLQDVTVDTPQYPELLEEVGGFGVASPSSGTSILPEEAFPIATDTAMDSMMADLTERLDTQRRDVARLHDAVIPAQRRYTLEEFAQVFRRWDAFFSVEQESQDPLLKLWMEMLGEPYRLFGSSALGAHPSFGMGLISSAEGALARHMLLNMVVDNMDRWQPMASSLKLGTGRAITRRLRSVEQTSGNALDASYQFGQLYPEGGDATTEGERSSRTLRSRSQRETTARNFSTVAALPPQFRQGAAQGAGIAPDASVPILGLRRVESREGWSFLVDVVDPQATLMSGTDVVVAREHKVIPPEVVDYLLAAEQHRATLSRRHFPMAGTQAVGDAGARTGGLELAGGASQDIHLEGQPARTISDQARSLRDTQRTALDSMADRGIRISPPPPGPPALARLPPRTSGPDANASDPTTALVREFEGYFAEYFRQETMTQPAYRFATILVIASVQFGSAQQTAQIIDPGRIAEVIEEAMKISGITLLLSSFGPIGQILSRGYSAYMSANGVSELAAIQSLVSFIRLAVDADSLHKARVRARVVPLILGDVQELIDSVASRPATQAVEAMARYLQNPPRTPRELADFCRPMLDDPTARAALLEGVNARIRELELQGHDPLQPTEEYRTLRAFQEQLEGHARGESVFTGPDADLPLTRDRRPGEELGRTLSRRNDAQRESLHQALGPHRGLPLIENPQLGNAVRIHYLDGELRVEVGPDATPRHVEAHRQTITQLKRYFGVVGTLRRLRDWVFARLPNSNPQTPAWGSQGREARLEVDKLQRMIWDLQNLQNQVDTRATRLSGDDALARNPAEQAAITRELAGLQRQLAHFETLVHSTQPGRGFIASGDTTGRDAATRLREAETATRTQESLVDTARDEFRARREAQRLAEVPVRDARGRLAEAMEMQNAFRDDQDPAFRQQVAGEVALARQALAQAEATLRQARDASTTQRTHIEAQEARLHELRSAEVDVAREHLEGQLADLYRERRTALAAQREAHAETQRLSPELLRAQSALRSALEAERRRPPPSIQGLSRDQAIAVVQAAETAKAERLRPLREQAERLQRAYDTARNTEQSAQAQHRLATGVINRHIADFERRQAAAVGITPDRYDYLRSRTPDGARQTAVQRETTDAIYGTPIQGTPEADHIVPMFEIVRMPGFNRLTADQQVRILNEPANFWALDSRVNASKGNRSLRVWRGHPDAATFPPIQDADYQRLVEREDSARDHLRHQIDLLLPDPDTPAPATSTSNPP